jgi:perosamine synthetase
MIPVCEPLLGGNEEKYVLDCLKSNWISSGGSYLKKFEEGFAEYCGVKHGIAVCNGTVALHLAYAALGIRPDDEVIMPTLTISSTVFATMYCGAKPVFVDVEADTWNMNPAQLEKKITKKTKAIVPVHMYGHPCDMDSIMSIARRHRIAVIEDAAEAHGAQYKDKMVGSFGKLSCFSFYSNKIITCGEGGMVLTNDDKLAAKCRAMKNLSFLPEKRFWHKDIGFNYRMTNIQAAIGLAQLEQIDEMITRRRYNASLYNQALSGIGGLVLPTERPDVRNVYWMYGIIVDKSFGISRDVLMKKLSDKGIETRTFFIPMHNQPVLKKRGIADKGKYPISKRLGRDGFYLPSGSGLRPKDIEYITDVLKAIKKKA